MRERESSKRGRERENDELQGRNEKAPCPLSSSRPENKHAMCSRRDERRMKERERGRERVKERVKERE